MRGEQILGLVLEQVHVEIPYGRRRVCLRGYPAARLNRRPARRVGRCVAPVGACNGYALGDLAPMTTPAMADVPFEQALAAARSGDDQAFAQLWRSLNPALLRYLRVLAPKIADDVASETWLQVVRGLRGFSGDEAGFKSWLFTIARNKVTDAARQAARRPIEISDDDDVAPPAAPDDTAAAVLERLDTEAALALIAKLPPDQAEVIMLRVVAGLEVADVARVVRKSPGAVRVTSHRALRRLRELLPHSSDSAVAGRKAVTR